MSYLDATGVGKDGRLHRSSAISTSPRSSSPSTCSSTPPASCPRLRRRHHPRADRHRRFHMEEYVPGERCPLKRREDYWRKGEDGKPLPYLDEIVMVSWAMTVGRPGGAQGWPGRHDHRTDCGRVGRRRRTTADSSVTSTPTSATRTLRVRVDQEPWKDVEVRQALKHCHNREKILALALRGQGVIGNDSHVAPAHAEYCRRRALPVRHRQVQGTAGGCRSRDGVTSN